MECEICGTILPCVCRSKCNVCSECDEQFKYCFYECKNPCRDKKEQLELFNKIKPEWNTQN